MVLGLVWITLGLTYLVGTSTYSFSALAGAFAFALLLLPLTLFLGLEVVIAYLQAYIFTFITCITIKDMATYDIIHEGIQ
jgi:F0F1-type ATP synthase membrane subunit a